MPHSEEVVRRTDQVTKRIQELWSTMQAPDTRHAFVPCAERIRVAVAELTAIFPQVVCLQHVQISQLILYLFNVSTDSGLIATYKSV